MALGKKPKIITARMELITEGGDKTNVFFDIESANNPRARKAARGTDVVALIKANIKDENNLTQDETAAFARAKLESNAEVIAECITGWDWNGVSLFEGEDAFDKDCTPENVLELLQTQIDGIDILGQVTEKVAELGKPKPARKKS